MAGTGVLPFIRGIDLTLNDLSDDRFPEVMEDMISLRWLKLTSTHLKAIPEEISTLQKLEHLTLKKNNVAAIEKETLKGLKCLRTLNLSRNALTAQNISSDTFDSEELSTLGKVALFRIYSLTLLPLSKKISLQIYRTTLCKKYLKE